MMKIEVAPVSAIACVMANVIAFVTSNFLYVAVQLDVTCNYRDVVIVVLWCECCDLAGGLGGVQ
jgi:hypothetical protein